MVIHSINEPLFREYGKIVEGYDVGELLKVMDEVTPLPEGVMYVPEQPEMQALPLPRTFQRDSTAACRYSSVGATVTIPSSTAWSITATAR